MEKSISSKKSLKPIILKQGGYENHLKQLRKVISEHNQLLEVFEADRNMKFTDNEANSLLWQSLNIKSILDKQNFKSLPPELRDIAKDGLRKALEHLNRQFATLQVPVKGGRFLRDFVRVEKGRFCELESTENDLKELFVLQIDEPEKLQAYYEAKELAERMVKLSERMQEPMQNLFTFDFWNQTIDINDESFCNFSKYY